MPQSLTNATPESVAKTPFEPSLVALSVHPPRTTWDPSFTAKTMELAP